MFEDHNSGLDDYERMEQKILDDSDNSENNNKQESQSKEKQLCCLGHPVGTGRMIGGFLVLLAWIVVFFAVGDLDEDSIEYLIVNLSGIPALVIAFKIWLK